MTQKPAGALCEPARLLEELQTDRRKPRVSGIDTSAPYIDPKVCCGAQPHSFPPHRCEPSSLDRPPALASSFHEKALSWRLVFDEDLRQLAVFYKPHRVPKTTHENLSHEGCIGPAGPVGPPGS